MENVYARHAYVPRPTVRANACRFWRVAASNGSLLVMVDNAERKDVRARDQRGSELTAVKRLDGSRIQGPMEPRMSTGGMLWCAISTRSAATATVAVRMCTATAHAASPCPPQW